MSSGGDPLSYGYMSASQEMWDVHVQAAWRRGIHNDAFWSRHSCAGRKIMLFTMSGVMFKFFICISLWFHSCGVLIAPPPMVSATVDGLFVHLQYVRILVRGVCRTRLLVCVTYRLIKCAGPNNPQHHKSNVLADLAFEQSMYKRMSMTPALAEANKERYATILEWSHNLEVAKHLFSSTRCYIRICWFLGINNHLDFIFAGCYCSGSQSNLAENQIELTDIGGTAGKSVRACY